MNVDSDSTRIPVNGPGADDDKPYTWGLAPSMYLAQRQIARLMVFRSRLDDRSALRNRVYRLPQRSDTER